MFQEWSVQLALKGNVETREFENIIYFVCTLVSGLTIILLYGFDIDVSLVSLLTFLSSKNAGRGFKTCFHVLLRKYIDYCVLINIVLNLI